MSKFTWRKFRESLEHVGQVSSVGIQAALFVKRQALCAGRAWVRSFRVLDSETNSLFVPYRYHNLQNTIWQPEGNWVVVIQVCSAEDPQQELWEEDLKMFKIDFKGVWTQYHIAQNTIWHHVGSLRGLMVRIPACCGTSPEFEPQVRNPNFWKLHLKPPNKQHLYKIHTVFHGIHYGIHTVYSTKYHMSSLPDGHHVILQNTMVHLVCSWLV